MKKVLCAISLALVLTGCGYSNIEKINANHAILCVKGVNYLMAGNGVTVMYDKTGNIAICGEN